MIKNEKLLQKLRNFRLEKQIELRNKNLDKQVDIEDVFYCGKLNFEENGKQVKKDVFLVVKNIDGKISMVYCIDNDEIAVQMDIAKMIDEDGIIPTEKYKDRNKDFEKLKENEDKRVSLNKLEEDRISRISNTIGIKDEDVKAVSEIDTKDLKEEEILRKSVNVKSEFDPNTKITSSESFSNLIPGSNSFSKIAIIYSDNTSNKFTLVGITGKGQVEKLDSLIPTEGTNPTEKIVSSNRDGSEVKEETVSSMYKIKGRANEGFTMNIGSSGGVEVNYVRRGADDEYISIPIEATHTRYVNSEIKRDMDKTKNTRVEEEIDRAKAEFEEHNNKANWKNIDDDENNDIGHEDIIKLENGTETTFEEEAKKAKISLDEFKRIYNEQSESLTQQQRLENTHEEIEEQFRGLR